MPTLSAMFKLLDGGYNSALNKINSGMDKAIRSTLGASQGVDKVNTSLEKTGAAGNRGASGLAKVENMMESTQKKASTMNSTLKGLVGTLLSIGAAKKAMDMTDVYTNTNARLNMINDGTQNQEKLQQKIFDAADRSRGKYADMASAVAKMNLLAGDNFTSNDEAIQFTELLQKSLKVSGADTSEQQSAFLQLSQSMAAGKLQGDEFRSIMENAPMVAEAISKYMGVSKGELKELSSKGVITADVIKNALFEAAGDINEKFNSMPMTFADIWTQMGNQAMESFGGVFIQLNGLINSSGAQELLAAFSAGIDAVADGASWLISTIASGDPIVKTFFAVAIIMAGLWAAKMLIAAGASLAAVWPLLLIVGVIAAVILGLTSMGVTFSQIFGLVGGRLGELYAVGYNVVSSLWNIFVSFAEFIANVFTNPLAAVVNLFVNMATSVLGVIESIAQAIDTVFGSNLAGAVNGFSSRLQAWGDSFKDSNYVSLDDMRMDTKNIMETSDAWKAKGSDMGAFLDNWDFQGKTAGADIDSGIGIEAVPYGSLSNPATVKGKGKNGAVDVDMSDEDIQYLRDIAQRDYVAKISTNTLAPNIKIEFSGPITKEADTEVIAGTVEQVMRDEIANSAEGKY